jgi:hypothetical protein
VTPPTRVLDDLERLLIRYVGNDPLLRQMRSFVRYGDQMTLRQRQAVERHLADHPTATRDGATP